MAILVGVLVALFVVWLTIVSPGFRKFILGLVILVGGGIALFVDQHNRKEENARRVIKPSEIELRDVELTSTYGSRSVVATVKNLSKQHEVSELALRVQIYDCPTMTLDQQCEIIGESTARSYTDIPPGQVRAFNSSVYFSDMPTPRNFVWTYSIKEIVARY